MMVSGLVMASLVTRRRLGGCGLLQTVQEVRRALRMGCGGEDRAFVVLQYLD
jgi:hypothetical protein